LSISLSIFFIGLFSLPLYSAIAPEGKAGHGRLDGARRRHFARDHPVPPLRSLAVGVEAAGDRDRP
jgi:hypothetical protein